MMKLSNRILVIFFMHALSITHTSLGMQPDEMPQRRIVDVKISGNEHTPTGAILNYVPFKVGAQFHPFDARQTIINLYENLPRFSNIVIKGITSGDDQISIQIDVTEKHQLSAVEFDGNKTIKEKELREKVDFEKGFIEEQELAPLALLIKKLYLDRGFHETKISPKLHFDEHNRATALFHIDEGKKSLIKRIRFTGNTFATDKKLRTVVFSREDWIIGFLDQSGTYNPERIEYDKYLIEQFYQNNGFLHAKVIGTRVEHIEGSPHINLIFEIEEGDQYYVDEIAAPGNDVLSQEQILAYVPIKAGQPYSRERITNAIKTLERLWGNYGYIFAHIEPSIQPDEDKKTVSVSFISDVGHKVNLNRITIKGNKKTRDKIIRRRLTVQEGELLTKSAMDRSRSQVESLGYFDQRDGVNWKLRRLSDELADLDLMIKEDKTGNFHLELGFGGSAANFNSSAAGVTVKGGITDRNLFGSGINMNLDASWAREEQTLNFHIGQPWLFDKPISGSLDVYHRRPSFDNLRLTNGTIFQTVTGGALTAGVITNFNYALLSGTQMLGSFGFDSQRYNEPATARIIGGTQQEIDDYQCILNKEFAPGDFFWFGASFEQDTRNHPIHTSRGHKWQLYTKFAFPSFNSNIGFYKVSLDTHWYTPIIDEYNLILHLAGYAGFTGPWKNRDIPFAELYHIGGPKTVRGFLFGQIGPKYLGDPIGAQKALFCKAELIFPITPDMTMKGVAFYDGGAGFDTPYTQCITGDQLTSNNFDYRHSVGVGLRILNPMPISIDWGFKLDRRKNKFNPDLDESSHEVHFGMTYDW